MRSVCDLPLQVDGVGDPGQRGRVRRRDVAPVGPLGDFPVNKAILIQYPRFSFEGTSEGTEY